MKIELEFEEGELIAFIKEEWYKSARRQARIILENHLENHVSRIMNDDGFDIKGEMRTALKEVMHTYQIRAMDEMRKIIKVTDKIEKKTPSPKN